MSKKQGAAFASLVTLVIVVAFEFSSSAETAESPVSPMMLPAVGTFKPIPLPDPKIPGFRFPEVENSIIGWTSANNQKAINGHGWGIWTTLHMPSGESFNGQPLSVYETWLTPNDIASAEATGTRNLAAFARHPRPAGMALHQFLRHRRMDATSPHGDGTITGFVKYDPDAANHILDKGLFKRTSLSTLLSAGQTDIPAFSSSAIALKVVYKRISQSSLIGGRYFMLPSWPGTPPVPQQFDPSKWNQCVWVDLQDSGSGTGTGEVDTQCKKDGSSRTPKTTYGLGRFSHYQLSAADAQAMNALRSTVIGPRAGVALAGDVEILVGMHVTSREIGRWTWQTFWWTPDPANPPAPSSAAIAADRPRELQDGAGPAKNYAMSIGYDMVEPATPSTGGPGLGTPIYVYNPWLEAGFGPQDLPNSKSWTFNGKTYDNKFGVQTNCMSCHAQANFTNASVPTAPDYTADRYIDLNNAQFKGTLKVDFLWSIPGNAQ